ncbi:MAG: macrolide ABC transporter ATP-binding protein [Gammaproteobacteria bacterium GWF2_41_13]|nr:MAG: macrolide ABC transporter ATP-binding protein [Gammaproteobacteria bacterium GWF2_41_13]
MNNPIVLMQAIRKTYQSGSMSFEALKGIDLQINAGEYIAILGPSGSGKSTLMHIIGCLSTPTSGRYVLNGREVGHLNRNELASVRSREIGFVFQSFNLLPYLNVLENVMLPLDYQGMAMAERVERSTAVIEQLGLLTHRAHRPNQLSGGQQQRVAIARALVTQPNILLADEPTGNLDSQSGNEVIKLFERFSSEGKTVILVTHDLAVAKRTRRIIKIHDGLITEDRMNK